MHRKFLLVLCFLLSFQLQAKPLVIMLDWFLNPDHAPLVIAQQRGFFKQAGLEVTLQIPTDPSSPPKLVSAGQVDLAISYQPQLHIHIDAGLPIIQVGTLVATPLNALVVLEKSSIHTLKDLKGKKIGFSVGGFEDAILKAMLKPHGLGLKDVELINVNFSLSPALISGQVDAVIGAFRNFELNQMDLVNHPGRAFFVEEQGVLPYDELIYIAHKDKLNPDLVRKFLKATEQAVQFIINHPAESWQIFANADSTLNNELNRRAFKDTIPRFALRPSARDHQRYADFAKFLVEHQVIKKALTTDQYLFE